MRSPTPSPRRALRALVALGVLLSAPLGAPAPALGAPDAPEPAPALAPSPLLERLAALDFAALGHPATRWDHVPPVRASRERPHQLLVALVRFPDLPFERFRGDARQDELLSAHYQAELFDPTYARPNTLSHYYHDQSYGRYHLQGLVLPPLTLDHPRAHYGRPRRPEGGAWRNDAAPEDLVEEVLAKVGAARPDLDWARFDQWDPSDADGDGVREEPDGYLDHLVIVYAGGGQSSCQGLYKLQVKLNPNVGEEVLERLNARELECADRIWPHRFVVQRREGEGPRVGGASGALNALGGAPVREGLWARDYNMQSEYTEPSTFIHEFGHSIGLPDVYARETNNSTGPWEVMSGTASPSPQGLSAWSRLMLGWLTPVVLTPPAAGGARATTLDLLALDAPLGAGPAGAARAALIALPPQRKVISLAPLDPARHGAAALYSGQGNELNRALTLDLDLRALPPGTPVALSFDAWWEIEAGWDFAYIEAREAPGAPWRRLVDPAVMPARHGHDGPRTLPGLTGRSGDRDGDGKNESHPACDPARPLAHGDERDSLAGEAPCEAPTWVEVRVDLSPLAGLAPQVRVRYFTDPAAVERGLLLDNLRVVAGAGEGARELLREGFEGAEGAALDPRLSLGGFLKSGGRHSFEVPHFYLLERRDPYAGSADPASRAFRYDSALADPGLLFGYDPAAERVRATRLRARPGALLWYANGAYAWSENEPTQNGPGRGFLLLVDSNPNELPLPGWEGALKGDPARADTRYELSDDAAQGALRAAALKTMCFVRAPWAYPADLPAGALEGCPGPALPHLKVPAGGALKTPRLGYEVVNDLLPGAARAPFALVGELYDYREVKGALRWSLRERALRALHLLDAPFSSAPFEGGQRTFDVVEGRLAVAEARAHPAAARFSDREGARWLNPHLRFGGVEVPSYGLAVEFEDVVTAEGEALSRARVVWE